MTYIRGDIAEFDLWEDLGNPGWNWASMLPYYKMSEKYTIPSDAELAAGANYQARYHGFEGHVHTGYIPTLTNGSFAPVVIQTWEALSLVRNPDLNSGDTRGFSMGPQTLDPETNIRWDSARAYLHPVEGRHNLKVLKGTVKRITWAPGKAMRPPCGSSDLVANGVEYFTEDGELHSITVKKEVVVSAGAVRSPLVLEGSGIGNPRLEASLSPKPQWESNRDICVGS